MTRLTLVIIGTLLAQRVSAQEPNPLHGTWTACFMLTAPVPNAPHKVCGEVTFRSGLACGRPIVHFAIPIDSLKAWLPYQGGDVQVSLTDSSISFGGRIEPEAPRDGGPTRCLLHGDDGSLYGEGAGDVNALTGTWGITGFAAAEPLGTFTMHRH